MGSPATGLPETIRDLSDLSDVDSVAARLPGSFHLVASLGGRVRVQGTASGLRPIYHARLAGVTVAASRADVLAWLAGAGVDEEQVAVRLLDGMPHPLALTPVWRGVGMVEPGSWLRLDPDGSARAARWWTPPTPEVPLAEGAGPVREALVRAVAARTAPGGIVTCDLSGGMDSTTMCFLAADGPAKVIARTMSSPDPAGDDLVWARRAAQHLPHVQHIVVSGEDWPLRYAGLSDFDEVLDEPTLSVVSRPELARFFFTLSDLGARLHLTGIGGDHVTWSGPTHYHDLLPRRPLLALRQLRGFRALHHWPLGETLRALADRRPYRKWMAGAAESLQRPQPGLEWTLGWAHPPRLAGWVTTGAADNVRAAMKRAAETAEPLAPTRGSHVELAVIRQSGRWLRQVEQMCARAGVPMASPFYDDQVISACLAIRPQDRATPWRYRPVLREAMRGIVPDDCLRRTTKGVFSLPAARSLERHRADLLALWTGSRLGAMGIVDESRIRAAIGGSMTESEQAHLDTAISVEVWLRGIQR